MLSRLNAGKSTGHKKKSSRPMSFTRRDGFTNEARMNDQVGHTWTNRRMT